MRLKLALLSLCTFAITAGALFFILTKGEDYHAALMTAPERMKDEVASRKKSLRRRIGEKVWRIKERKTAAAVDRIMAASGRVFAGAPETARTMEHLRRLIAGRLADDRTWIRLSPSSGALVQTGRDIGIVLGPGMAALPPLDAARVFWEHAQRVYDADARLGRSTDDFTRLRRSLAERTLESEARALRVGCGFLNAGVGLGLPHDARSAEAAECGDGVRPQLSCYPTAAEIVTRDARTGSVSEDACVELERVVSGNPLDLRGFSAHWTMPECLRRAREIVSAPGWRDSDALCAEAEAAARARGLAFMKPLR